MRTITLILLSVCLASGPAFAEFDDCSRELMIESQQTLAKFRKLDRKIAQDFPSSPKGTSFSSNLAFELLLSSQLLGSTSRDGWIFLRDLRDHVGFDVNDPTGKRSIAALLDNRLMERKDNPERRTEKLVRITDKGQQLINQILGQ